MAWPLLLEAPFPRWVVWEGSVSMHFVCSDLRWMGHRILALGLDMLIFQDYLFFYFFSSVFFFSFFLSLIVWPNIF